MTNSISVTTAFQTLFFRPNKVKALASASAPNLAAAPLLVSTAVALLIVASGGFGVLFAWRVGSKHDVLLGVLSVVMALGLEVSKPFAIDASFRSLREWKFIQAAMLAVVGLLAVAYSLQAELAFAATTRGDLVAERRGEVDTAQRAEARYQRAQAELATLKPTGTTKSATNAYLARREALQAEIKAAELDRRTAPTVTVADPGAVALATYAGAIGAKLDAEQLGLWLPLVGVLALELGSALGLVLVRAATPVGLQRAPEPRRQALNDEAAEGLVVQGEPPAIIDDAAARERVKSAILNQLAERGGSAASSERGLAALIGTSRPTVRRAIHALVIAGLVAAEATRNGTMLRLVA